MWSVNEINQSDEFNEQTENFPQIGIRIICNVSGNGHNCSTDHFYLHLFIKKKLDALKIIIIINWEKVKFFKSLFWDTLSLFGSLRIPSSS